MDENITIIDKKGIVTPLYKFNQDLKNIFSEYVVLPSKMTVGVPVSKIDKGFHFVIDGFNIGAYIDTNIFGIRYNAKSIFDGLKINKKDTDGLMIDNNLNISYYGSKEKKCIGETIGVVHMNEATIPKQISPYISMNFNKLKEIASNFSAQITLDEEDVKSLVGNEIINIDAGEYSTRISRELVPGLKKSDKVFIDFIDVDGTLYQIIIKAIRSECTSFHCYTAIRFR